MTCTFDYLWLLHPRLCLHPPFLNCSNQSGVIAFGLVGICFSKGGNGLVERIAVAQVAADLCRVTRTSMRVRQGGCTQLDIQGKRLQVHCLDLCRELHIVQLSYIEIPATKSRPTQENVCCCLHHALSNHHPFAMVVKRTCPQVRLEHR